jgi:hypothetical protein
MATVINPFDSPRSMLARAKHHIAELQRQIKVFFDEKPHEFIHELDPDGIRETFKLRFTKGLSESCTHLGKVVKIGRELCTLANRDG